MVVATAIYSREQLGISRTQLCGAIPSACHPCREIHLLSADALRSYCCLLLPRGSHKSCRVNEKGGRGGGDRTTCGVEDAQVIDSTKRQRGEKPQIRLTEVHAGYTRGIVFLAD